MLLGACNSRGAWETGKEGRDQCYVPAEEEGCACLYVCMLCLRNRGEVVGFRAQVSLSSGRSRKCASESMREEKESG